MRKLHIIHGGVENKSRQWLLRASKLKWTAKDWTTPQCAEKDDDVVIFVPKVGLFATGKCLSESQMDWGQQGRYSAEIGHIRLLEPPIPLSAVRRDVPRLTWAIYPRNYTTPKPPVAEKLRKLISTRRTGRSRNLGLKALDTATLEELRILALLGARKTAPRKMTQRVYRVRCAAIRAYVLKRAGQHCEGCNEPAPFRNSKGAPYLEPHHTTRLSDDGPDDPARVIALCPNCHRRAHYSNEAKRFNFSLKMKLARIERVG